MATTLKPTYKTLSALFLAIILIVGFVFIFFQRNEVEVLEQPASEIPQGWEMFQDTTAGISFNYPKTFPTTYLHPVDWPPQVQILDEAFSCNEAGVEIERVGETSLQTINGSTYCVTKISEGAAGSTYTQYAYATIKEGKFVIVTFSLRFAQCGNYDEPKMKECTDERETFDINPIIDEVARSVRVN